MPSAEVHKARRTVNLVQGRTTSLQGSVWVLDTPSARNVGAAPIARARSERIYLPPAAPALSRARCRGDGPEGRGGDPDGRARPRVAERRRALHAPVDGRG